MSGEARRGQSGLRPPPALPPRRLFVVGGVAAALGLLVDHGLRLDLPQPPPPVPTRRPAPDEALLVTVVRDLEDLLALWPRTGSNRNLAMVRGLLTAQRTVLEGRLTNAGVPAGTMTAAPTTTRGAPLSRAALARRLRTVDPAVWTATARATTATRELLTAAYGIRLAGAELVGSTVPLGTPSPVRGALLERTSPLVYAFEVVAAQSTGKQRRLALVVLSALEALEREAAAGLDTAKDPLTPPTGGAPGQPGGWSLPGPVTDPTSARQLGDHVLEVAMASTADALGPDPAAASVEDVARWAAHVDVIAAQWGLTLTAFPGAK